jgi:competence protein ComFB
MAKKSSKTEQVLKLISTEETVEAEESIADNLSETSAVSQQEAGILVNLTEYLVKEWADEIIKRLGVCNCDICKNDVMALALNDLKNKYVTTNTGKLHVQLDVFKKQYETDVISALTRACVRVKASPRHTPKE